MIYLILIPFYIVSSLASESLQGPVSILHQLNISSFPEQNQCADSSELMKKCALDLCGPPKDNPSSLLTDFTFDKYVQPDKMKKFETVEEDLKELIDLQFKENDAFITKLKEDLDKEGGSINFDTLKPWDYGNLATRRFYNYAHFTTDTSKPISERVTYILDFPPDASETLKKGVTAFAEGQKKMMETVFTQGVYDGFYTLEEAEKKLKLRWEKFLLDYETRKKVKPDYLKDNAEEIEKIKTELSTAKFQNLMDLGHFSSRLDTMEGYATFVKTGHFPAPTYLCEQEDCKKAIKEEIGKIDFKEMIKEFEERSQDRQKLTSQKMAFCKSQFAMKTIKSYENEKFKKLIPEVKAALLKNVLSTYSEHSREAFKKYLDNEIHFAVRTFTNDEDQFIDQVKEDLNSRRNYGPANDTTSLIERALSLFDYNDVLGRMSPLNKMYICEDSTASITWDSFLPKKLVKKDSEGLYPDDNPDKDNINISMFTCTHHQHGKGILAHELGHALSWAFYDNKLSEKSYKEFMEMRACANKLYKKDESSAKPIFFEHNNDKYRTEEDMADLIGYKTIPDKSNFVGCSLLEPSEDGTAYQNVEIRNSIDADSHSSALLRVLQEAIHKRRAIPASCQEVINNNKDNYRFEPCF